MDYLPTVANYRNYLNQASQKFNFSLDQCRDKFGLFTIKQWKRLLRGELKTISREQLNKMPEDYKGVIKSKKGTAYNKITLLSNDQGKTKLEVENETFVIVETEKENINPLK